MVVIGVLPRRNDRQETLLQCNKGQPSGYVNNFDLNGLTTRHSPGDDPSSRPSLETTSLEEAAVIEPAVTTFFMSAKRHFRM